ncbi:lpcat1, partial [Symbiodinium natans]
VDRSDPKSRSATIKAIEDHVASWKHGKQPLLLFPEGTTSNGESLLEFKKGAFVPGVAVRPAVLCYTGSWDPASVHYRANDDGKIQAIGDTEWAEQFLGHMMHSVRIRVLPPYVPSEEEKQDPLLFAKNVREVMTQAHGELRAEAQREKTESERRSLQAYAHRGVEAVEDMFRFTGLVRERSGSAPADSGGGGDRHQLGFQRIPTTGSGAGPDFGIPECGVRARFRNPKPETLNPKPETLSPKP